VRFTGLDDVIATPASPEATRKLVEATQVAGSGS
jgi:hypothetical protein